MTGKEALEIVNNIKEIYHYLIQYDDKCGFFEMGRLVEKLDTIVRIDSVSFNPTLSKEEVDEL